MQHYKVYFWRFIRWVKDAFPFWLFLGVFIGATVLPLPFKLSPNDHIYYTGFLLQFSAFLTIIIRINSLRKYFDDDNRDFIRLIIEWFKRFPSIFKKAISVKSSLSGTAQSVSGGSGALDEISQKTLEQRVADLEEKLNKLEKNLRETKGRLNERINEIVRELRKQINELNNEVKSTKKETKEFKADSLKFEIVWSAWLILGITIRTFSEVIGSWFA